MSAKPAPKKKTKTAGRERSNANLTRGGKRTTPAQRLSLLELDGFCLAYFVEKSVERACAARKIGVQRGWKYAKDPRFQERLQLIGQKLIDKATDKVAQDIADEFTLRVSKVDERMFGILDSPPHPYRGDADKVTAGLTLYKRLKLIEGVRVAQSTSIVAGIATQSAPAAIPMELPRLFEPPWRKALREAQTVGQPTPIVIEGKVD